VFVPALLLVLVEQFVGAWLLVLPLSSSSSLTNMLLLLMLLLLAQVLVLPLA
jgi:hypothetical protein